MKLLEDSDHCCLPRFAATNGSKDSPLHISIITPTSQCGTSDWRLRRHSGYPTAVPSPSHPIPALLPDLALPLSSLSPTGPGPEPGAGRLGERAGAGQQVADAPRRHADLRPLGEGAPGQQETHQLRRPHSHGEVGGVEGLHVRQPGAHALPHLRGETNGNTWSLLLFR